MVPLMTRYKFGLIRMRHYAENAKSGPMGPIDPKFGSGVPIRLPYTSFNFG